MQKQESNKDRNIHDESEVENENRAKLDQLCKCDRIISESEIADFGNTSKFDSDDDLALDSDDCDEDLVVERLKLNKLLDLPENTHSLTRIVTNLPQCLKYNFRSGLTHMNMKQFSPLSRGLQGPAIAVAAIATSMIIKPNCWNEPVIDRIVEDGDTYFAESYKKVKTDDRRTLKLFDLQRELDIRGTYRVTVQIDDPMFVGTFRSESPKEMHIAKAIVPFFQKYNSCILTSSVLNVAIWKCCKFFNFFDGQARHENCEIADPLDEEGFAKLILLQSLADVLFMILEKSNVKNESFLLYGIEVVNVKNLSDLAEDNKTLGEPKRRPGGYLIRDKYRAVVQGSYHLEHPILPTEFQRRGHLVLAIAVLVYSRLLSGNKWSKVMIDLIFNQSHIYLADLARVLGKTLDGNFELTIKDLLCDVVLGVYTAKIKAVENVIPGMGKKGKMTIDVGLRDFFKSHTTGVIEIKKIFYAIWKEDNKYYMLDPFGCDQEGFRIDPTDSDNAERYKKAAACITMNSSVDQLVEMILENTENKDKDPFIIHGLQVLYIKAGSSKDGSDEKVIFRAKKINRRPVRPPTPLATKDECEVVIDSLPRPKIDPDLPIDEVVQYPQIMNQVELFIKTFEENNPVKKEDVDEIIQSPGYKIVNPNRLTLRGTKSCLSCEFDEKIRGRQGLVTALVAVAESEKSDLVTWVSADIDKIISDGNSIYKKIASWIHQGSPEDGLEEDSLSEQSTKESQSSFTADIKTEDIKILPVKGLDYMDLSMIPNKFKIGDADVNLIWKMNVVEGEANPLANLGEALEKYFEEYDQAILENNKLTFAIWKKYDKFFMLNPYGNDQDGWLARNEPAALFVVDKIIGLVNLLYGLLQFNDYNFTLHFIKLILPLEEEEEDATSASIKLQTSEINTLPKYKTKFLPVTEADLADIKITDYEAEQSEVDNVKSVSEIEENNIKVKESNSETKSDSDEENANVQKLTHSIEEKEMILNIFEEIPEPKQADAPSRLNLALVTGIVKIEQLSEEALREKSLEIYYEKLKYNHPPPFVLPPKKNLCALLDAKLASKSVQSLLSRFSIDSKLAIKDKNNVILSGQQDATVSLYDTIEKSKLITLPPKKYFFSKSLPTGLTPIRAINELFIQDRIADEEQEEKCRRKKKEEEIVKVPETEPSVPKEKILPVIIPLGPCIMTPKPIPKAPECPDRKKRKCPLSPKEKEDTILKKLVCSTENLLLEIMYPNFKEKTEKPLVEDHPLTQSAEDIRDLLSTTTQEPDSEPCGFKPTDNENIGIISANTSLEDRKSVEDFHYKSCFFAAILTILAKINVSVNELRSGVLDRFIRSAEKIGKGTGKLQYKISRCFRNFNILDVKYNVVLKQIRYAEPEHYEQDDLKIAMSLFLYKYQTGILVFHNVAYAFWFANNMFYLFDSYACDENGVANEDGSACLMQICSYDSFVERVLENTGDATEAPYRLYTILITHLESQKKKKKLKLLKKQKSCKKQLTEEIQANEEEKVTELDRKCESETSLIELTDWINKDKLKIISPESFGPGFLPIKNFNASAIEVEILENKITRPILAPFKVDPKGVPIRDTPYDRTFFNNSTLSEPMDLCVMAWSQIYYPTVWSIKTFQALFEASKEYAHDSLMASEDTTVKEMTDNLLTDFNIANYSFRVAFAPMHNGTLYKTEGWNLAMTLDSIFNAPIYTGAVLVCEKANIAIMKKEDRLYAWWLINGTKKIRMIVSDDMEDYLKIIVKEINQPKETEFSVRIVTISYAKILGPNCSDIEGLHESMMPSTSLAEIHTKNTIGINDEAVFRLIDKTQTPAFVHGSVALSERDTVTEPSVKRCYFVALFVMMLKRDIIQNPLPEMIDKVLELAESSYKMFNQPKYHTEHILKHVCMSDRLFEIRDCASNVTSLQDENKSSDELFLPFVKKQLKQFFKKSTSGILHFSNCCYGFWFSPVTNCYYYLDPYQCNEKGKRVCKNGKSCLCVFCSISDLAKQMCINQYEETTGFFIHRIHIELVNESPYKKFQEDPIWTYLDYHWSYRHLPKVKAPKRNNTNEDPLIENLGKKPSWKNYLIEVPNTIYSVWGTVGSFDLKFGCHAGKTQAAIGIALMAMCDLCHPSEWSTVVLDSAVLCGDCYYKESKKVTTRCCNRFGLAKCLKVSPYLWDVEYKTDICGVLYGTKDQKTLADVLNYALGKSSYLLLQCDKKILTILQTTDAFYAMDSSWTGLPLFAKDHGSIYVLRCKDRKTLIYVLTKMLNTNRRLEFSITPVRLRFSQETCQTSNKKQVPNRKKILDKPCRTEPGKTINHSNLVNGSVIVPDEDSYLCYSRNLKLGLVHGAEYELPPSPKVVKKSVAMKKKHVCGPKLSNMKPSSSQKLSDSDRGFKFQFNGAVPTILNQRIQCPRIVDLVKSIQTPKRQQCNSQALRKYQNDIAFDKLLSKILDGGYSKMIDMPTHGVESEDASSKLNNVDDRFNIGSSFIKDENRFVFYDFNDELKKDVYQTYKHTKSVEHVIPVELNKSVEIDQSVEQDKSDEQAKSSERVQSVDPIKKEPLDDEIVDNANLTDEKTIVKEEIPDEADNSGNPETGG